MRAMAPDVNTLERKGTEERVAEDSSVHLQVFDGLGSRHAPVTSRLGREFHFEQNLHETCFLELLQ